MAVLDRLQTEQNLGFKVDRQIAAADTTIYLRFFNRVTGAATEPVSTNRTNLVVSIDKDNSNHEILILGTVGAASGGISTCTGVIRFIAFDGDTLTAGTGKAHAAEAEGGCADTFASFWNPLQKWLRGTVGSGFATLAIGDGTAADQTLKFWNNHTTQPKIYIDDSNESQLKGHRGDDEGAAGDFAIGCPILTTAERDLLTSPLNGMRIYNSSLGQTQFREAGAWVTNVSGTSIAFATTTAGGKVERGTNAEVLAGTASGSEGVLCPSPADIAIAVQNSSWNSAADAGGSDTYVITLAPAPTAYATRQMFIFTANTANTGAATLNVNGLGAKTIVKGDSTALETGDIKAGQVVVVVYDGTNMVMVSMSDLLVSGGDAGDSHYHDSVDRERLTTRNMYRIADCAVTASTQNDRGGHWRFQTAAANNDIAKIYLRAHDDAAVASLQTKNPEFNIKMAFASAAAQEGFIGFVDDSLAGTSLEDSIMTLDHVGFVIQDATLYGSVADGTTQQKTSAITVTLTQDNEYRITFNGTTATFYLNGASQGTLNTNVPNDNLNDFTIAVIADASGVAKEVYINKSGAVSWGEF